MNDHPLISPGDAFIARFLARLPSDLAATFTADQLAAVRLAFGMRYVMDHAVDVRRTDILHWGRFYLVQLGGRDWRKEGRSWAPSRRTAVGLAAILALSAWLFA